jgi:hypothetical protein
VKNVGDVLVRQGKIIGMQEVVCANFAVIKIFILLLNKNEKKSSDKYLIYIRAIVY